MPYTWDGPGVLTRVGAADVHPGEEFSPTDAERKSFAKAISETTDDKGEDSDTDADDAEAEAESGAEDTPVAEKHWRTAVSEIEAGEHDDHLADLAENDALTDSVTEAVVERQAELT